MSLLRQKTRLDRSPAPNIFQEKLKEMAGKGGKGLVVRMTTTAYKDKDKERPTSRSSRAGLQFSCFFIFLVVHV